MNEEETKEELGQALPPSFIELVAGLRDRLAVVYHYRMMELKAPKLLAFPAIVRCEQQAQLLTEAADLLNQLESLYGNQNVQQS